MVRAQHRFLCLLKFEREPALQDLAFVHDAFQTDHLFPKLRGMARSSIHPGIKITNFALQSERAVVSMFSPTNDVAANPFAGSGNELQFGMLLRQAPRAFGSVDDISVANVIIKVAYTLVESNDASQWQGAFNGNGRLRCCPSIQDQAVQPAFADCLYNFNRPFR